MVKRKRAPKKKPASRRRKRPSKGSSFQVARVVAGVFVLLVAAQGHRIALFPGDTRLLGHILRGLDHGTLGPGIPAEIVHHPVFGQNLSAGAVGIGPDGAGHSTGRERGGEG